MTAIVIDTFEDKVFIFADGMCTNGDFVFSHSVDKIKRLDAETVLTICGDLCLLDTCEDLCLEGKFDQENLDKVKAEGDAIIVTSQNIKYVEFEAVSIGADKEDAHRAYLHTLNFNVCPLFFGSGTEVLSGTYLALDVKKAKSEKEYVQLVKKAYKIACKRLISMGELRSYETIKIAKDKPK